VCVDIAIVSTSSFARRRDHISAKLADGNWLVHLGMPAQRATSSQLAVRTR